MSIANRLAHRSAPARRAVIALLLLASVFASYAAVQFSFSDPELAAWWPAAGLCALAGMLARGRERWLVIVLVIVATGAGNLLAGRELILAFAFGTGNALETIVLAALLAPKGMPVRMSSLRNVTRFLWTSLVAALVAGVALATVAAVAFDRPFFEGLAQLSAAHASATLVIVPLALAPLTGLRWMRVPELVAQSAFLAGLTLLVFWPGNEWPLAFTPLVAFLWAAFRFPIIVISVQLLLTAFVVISLTTLGGGPFAAFDDGGRTPVLLIQLFLLVFAISSLIIAAARSDWFVLISRLRAQEEVLREGIVNAEAGIVIGELVEDRLDVVAINQRAERALGGSQPPFGVAALDELVRARAAGVVVFEREGRTFEASVAERRDTAGPDLLTIVVADVTEQQERERLALEGAEELRRLNAQKDDFISAVSHELRTPVTSILGFSEQLDDARLPADLAQAGEVIARNARRLADVIDDVLELSQLSALGGPLQSTARVDLVALARDCARDSEGLARARNITVHVEATVDSLVVMSRERELVRVCANLLSNAVKFSHENGTVSVAIRPRNGGAVVQVIDHGLGIPVEHRDMVWERFARAPLDAHRAVPGTGLGLPIVRALIETRLGGSVSLAETPGGGTTVEVWLPEHAPDAPAAISLAADAENSRGD